MLFSLVLYKSVVVCDKSNVYCSIAPIFIAIVYYLFTVYGGSMKTAYKTTTISWKWSKKKCTCNRYVLKSTTCNNWRCTLDFSIKHTRHLGMFGVQGLIIWSPLLSIGIVFLSDKLVTKWLRFEGGGGTPSCVSFTRSYMPIYLT